MKVIVSEQVRSFLVGERKYLEQHSGSAYQRLARRLREARKTLSDFPHAGSEGSFSVEVCAVLSSATNVLDYEIASDEVHILHMRHRRQRDPYLEHDAEFDFEDDGER